MIQINVAGRLPPKMADGTTFQNRSERNRDYRFQLGCNRLRAVFHSGDIMKAGTDSLGLEAAHDEHRGRSRGDQPLRQQWPSARPIPSGTCRRYSSFASFLSKISDAFHVLFDPLANHVEGLFLRLGGYLR